MNKATITITCLDGSISGDEIADAGVLNGGRLVSSGYDFATFYACNRGDDEGIDDTMKQYQEYGVPVRADYHAA